SVRSGEFTSISAGHYHAKQSSACVLSLQARQRDYPPTTDTIWRSLVSPRLKCSMPSHRIASGLVFGIPLVRSRRKQLARLRDPIEQQLFGNDLRGLSCNPRRPSEFAWSFSRRTSCPRSRNSRGGARSAD